MPKQISRRDLLKGSALTAAGLATGAVQASSLIPDLQAKELRIGVIGTGGKGWSGMQWAAEYGQIVALCDIDANERAKAMMEYPSAVSFEDYRDLIRTMKGEVDALIISTPDHHHATATALGMRAGMHCYTEKPLTRTIWEARKLGEIARQTGVASQMGNQSTANTPMRKAAALIRNGTFGKVKEIHLWTDRAGGWWPQGVERPAPVRTPRHVNFGLWIGPRPDRNYAPGYHPFAWRGWWDFGTGSLGDMGCHIFNMPFMALDLRDPVAVQAETSGHNRDSFPAWAIVHYEFGARGNRPALDLHWYDGGKKPAQSLVPGAEYPGNGVIVVCENDTVYSPGSENMEYRLVSGAPFPDIEIEESPGHMAEFARAALGGPPAVGNFQGYAGPLTETVLLGNLAIWANGPRVEWDAANMRTKGTDEFDELIRPKFRPTWEID